MTQRYSRRRFMGVVGAGAAAATLSYGTDTACAASRPAEGVRPNVVLYVVDDQGTTDAGCYGNPVIRTPGLDALARLGTRYSHAFCTTASCSASRSTILAGLHNHRTGQYGHQHSYHHFVSFPDLRTLPVLLDDAGYRTACAGKYHVAPEEVYHFQQYLNGPSPEEMADRCADFIGGEEPFFLYFCTHEPHRPFKRDGSETISPDDVIVPPYLPDSPECRDELAKYYGSVERTDRGLVRLMEALRRAGKWDDTMIIYISDNGIAFPGAKTTLYDPGMRLPCVVRNPYATQTGVVTDAMVSWIDIAPTILDFCGAMPKDYSFHGRSFFDTLESAHTPGWDEVYGSHTFHEITMYYPMRVIRTRKHKLIWNIAHGLDYPFASDLYASETWQGVLRRKEKNYARRSVEAYIHRPRFELYDLETDPLEVANLADDPGHRDVLDDLKKRLKAFQERTSDPWIVKWEYE